MSWTAQTIVILFEVGTREIEADVDGPFAIHPPAEDGPGILTLRNGEHLTVTHVPTGYAIVYGARSREQAETFCLEVCGLTDWERLTDGRRLAKDIRACVHRAVRRARAWPGETCGEYRRDAEPDFEPPDCTHASCDDYVAQCRYDALKATCELGAGHEGAHVFDEPPSLPATPVPVRAETS